MVRILILLLLLGSAQAQTLYCGQDTNLSAKVTLSNLALRSEEFDNAAWTKTESTITANSIIAPDGTLTADTVIETASTNLHGPYNNTPLSFSASTSYRWSGYFKKGTRDWVSLTPFHNGFRYQHFLNLTNCTLGTMAAGSTVIARSAGNGWCYMEVVRTTTSAASDMYWQAYHATGNNTNLSYLGAITQYFYVWGASVQLASSPSDYLATTSAAATLAGVCASGTTQSPLDPTKCIVMSDRGREIRTEAQIAIGSQ